MAHHPTIPILLSIVVGSCAPYEDGAPRFTDGVREIGDRPTVARSLLDPAVPLELGRAPDTATHAQKKALWWVNTFRVRAGLGPLDQREELNAASAAHAQYVLLNPAVYDAGLSIHEEMDGRTGFFGERFWERMATAGYTGLPFREVIAYQALPASAVAHWMETVYHRLPLLHPSAQHVGYAEAILGKHRINVLDIGAGDGHAPLIPGGVAWPADGATNVPLSWDGLESPQPPAPNTGYPSGPVVTLTFGLNAQVEVFEHVILDLDGEQNETLPHVFLTPDNDKHLEGESSVALYAEVPLQPGHTYRVIVDGLVDEAPFHRVWTFTTRRSENCKLIDQDCGVGKACYGTSNQAAVCAWAGARPAASACDYQNDCASGLTCVSGMCRRYCALSGDSWLPCEAACEAGHSIVDHDSDLGVCTPPTVAGQ